MAIDNFAVFILTHGRPHNVKTYKTLRRQGYTGPIYIIIDNEDVKADEYYKLYGDQVVMFDKAAIARTFDEGDNFGDRRAVIYARNACWGIAEELGIDYFLQLDDDYYEFAYRFSEDLLFKYTWVTNLDKLFFCVLQFFLAVPALSVAMAQGGDMMAGSSITSLRLKRKAMNTFFCSTRRPFRFVGRINEDVNTYVSQGNIGGLFFTFFSAIINQNDTQKHGGGMTDLYADSGTYIKSFYTVMYTPSCVRLAAMGRDHKRLHHKINWAHAVPCILREELRKS